MSICTMEVNPKIAQNRVLLQTYTFCHSEHKKLLIRLRRKNCERA